MRRISFSLVLSLGLGLSGTAIADTLVMESAQSAPSISRPAHGVTMDRVIQSFGEPRERRGPVGDPPISHWVYDDFIVYFEYQHVIHSVVPHRK